jgi:hypothetical protein
MLPCVVVGAAGWAATSLGVRFTGLLSPSQLLQGEGRLLGGFALARGVDKPALKLEINQGVEAQISVWLQTETRNLRLRNTSQSRGAAELKPALAAQKRGEDPRTEVG